MRPVCAILFAMMCAPMGAAELTLVLQFDNEYSTASLDAMEREVTSIVGGSGIKVEWRLLADLKPAETFDSVVVVRFRGECYMRPPIYMLDERGYYGFTHISDGDVLPFGEVECDKVASAIGPAMSKSQWSQSDSVLGRALGRVLAHELYHMLAKSQHHATDGVTRRALSPAQLVSGKLKMSGQDLKELRK